MATVDVLELKSMALGEGGLSPLHARYRRSDKAFFSNGTGLYEQTAISLSTAPSISDAENPKAAKLGAFPS